MTDHPDKVLIVDFGAQYTQLIARRVREAGVYSEIVPFDKVEAALKPVLPKAIILSGGPKSVSEAGARALEYVRGHVGAGLSPLCGNSIGVDRRFLDRYLPELDTYLHYRSIDVSSLKELCRRWYPDIYKKRPGKAETHRALDDVRESIAELRYYRETMLRPPEQPSS